MLDGLSHGHGLSVVDAIAVVLGFFFLEGSAGITGTNDTTRIRSTTSTENGEFPRSFVVHVETVRLDALKAARFAARRGSCRGSLAFRLLEAALLVLLFRRIIAHLLDGRQQTGLLQHLLVASALGVHHVLVASVGDAVQKVRFRGWC